MNIVLFSLESKVKGDLTYLQSEDNYTRRNFTFNYGEQQFSIYLPIHLILLYFINNDAAKKKFGNKHRI